jgi:hypothetical protein
VGFGGFPSDAVLEAAVRRTLDAHWVAEGYAAPHPTVYPWQWLWDSCFHVLVWLELGEVDRANRELSEAFGPQTASGFVPHMNYVRDPGFHEELWGRRDGSSITQPPMYGHAVAELARAGHMPADEVLEAATAGLRFLLDRRRHPSGLIRVCHPWETGADDSPRWDDYCPGGFDRDRWRATKDRLASMVETGPDGEALTNPAFDVAPAGFNAMVAFNARELASVTGDGRLVDDADALAGLLAEMWDPVLGTWVDAGSTADGSGRVRTLDALLGLLVDDGPGRAARVVDQLLDPAAHGGPVGPTGVHRAEPTFEPCAYWRGPVWPQLAYLMVLAVAPHSPTAAATLARATLVGAWASGLAEYWDPDTGVGLGAVPQSWTGLALVMGGRWGGSSDPAGDRA